MVQDYKQLQIWKRSMDLAVKLYRLTKKFPKSETYNLISQLRRAVTSISANITEGASRSTRKDFSRFLNQAYSSLKEIECLIILSNKLKYLQNEDFEPLEQEIDQIGRMIWKFREKIKS